MSRSKHDPYRSSPRIGECIPDSVCDASWERVAKSSMETGRRAQFSQKIHDRGSAYVLGPNHTVSCKEYAAPGKAMHKVSSGTRHQETGPRHRRCESRAARIPKAHGLRGRGMSQHGAPPLLDEVIWRLKNFGTKLEPW